MLGKRFSYIMLPTLLFSFFTMLLTATAKFSYQHPYATGEHFDVTHAGAIVHQPAAPNGPVARAVPVEAEHDFGLMDPLTMGTHSFVVRNRGRAPLKLQAGPTSCKCTLSDVSDAPIPPGGEGHVTVQWNTGRKNRFYAHEASIYTNDPSQKMINFSVRGVVRVQLAVDPPQAVFDRIAPGTPASKRLLVYSQVWDSIELQDVKSSLAGLNWTIEPADEQTRLAHEAQSAWWIRLTTPSELPEGNFSDWLQFQVVPTDHPEDAVEHQVILTGKTLRRLAVYGPGIDAQGVVSFGKVAQAAGAKRRLLLKVRDTLAELPVTNIQTTPSFLEVRVVADPDSSSKGLLYLEVEIPAGAPRSNFLAASPAAIHIDFDHPRIAQLDLTATFAVVE